MCEHAHHSITDSSLNPLQSQVSRRSFFRGMAAVTGTVVWASAATSGAGAQEGTTSSGGGFHVGRGLADMTGEPWGCLLYTSDAADE